jgi:hypothetical protein
VYFFSGRLGWFEKSNKALILIESKEMEQGWIKFFIIGKPNHQRRAP